MCSQHIVLYMTGDIAECDDDKLTWRTFLNDYPHLFFKAEMANIIHYISPTLKGFHNSQCYQFFFLQKCTHWHRLRTPNGSLFSNTVFSLNSFRTFMYCDFWPYVLWSLDFQIQKRIVSAETIWGNTVIYLRFFYSLR